MEKHLSINSEAVIDKTGEDATIEVSSELAYKRIIFVNVCFLGDGEKWLLVDAGIKGSAPFIKRAAAKRFGKNRKPAAIILTHGHFDHVGALESLLKEWDVPVYAHPLEKKYLDGTSSYPPPDPSVGGGLMAALSPLFPTSPIDISRNLKVLDSNEVPFITGWKWIHTPGHSPGHISLWNEVTRTLIAGDAFVTTRQESAYAAVTQEPEIHGPPKYFTADWRSAEISVKNLAELRPATVLTGHGRAITGKEVATRLQELASKFTELAVPENYQERTFTIENSGQHEPQKAQRYSQGELPLIDENISVESSNASRTLPPGKF